MSIPSVAPVAAVSAAASQRQPRDGGSAAGFGDALRAATGDAGNLPSASAAREDQDGSRRDAARRDADRSADRPDGAGTAAPAETAAAGSLQNPDAQAAGFRPGTRVSAGGSGRSVSGRSDGDRPALGVSAATGSSAAVGSSLRGAGQSSAAPVEVPTGKARQDSQASTDPSAPVGFAGQPSATLAGSPVAPSTAQGTTLPGGGNAVSSADAGLQPALATAGPAQMQSQTETPAPVAAAASSAVPPAVAPAGAPAAPSTAAGIAASTGASADGTTPTQPVRTSGPAALPAGRVTPRSGAGTGSAAAPDGSAADGRCGSDRQLHGARSGNGRARCLQCDRGPCTIRRKPVPSGRARCYRCCGGPGGRPTRRPGASGGDLRGGHACRRRNSGRRGFGRSLRRRPGSGGAARRGSQDGGVRARCASPPAGRSRRRCAEQRRAGWARRRRAAAVRRSGASGGRSGRCRRAGAGPAAAGQPGCRAAVFAGRRQAGGAPADHQRDPGQSGPGDRPGSHPRPEHPAGTLRAQ